MNSSCEVFVARQFHWSVFILGILVGKFLESLESILLLKPQVSVTAGCWWWAWLAGHGRHATVSASQEQTLSGRGARVYTCTCVHDDIPCTRLPN